MNMHTSSTNSVNLYVVYVAQSGLLNYMYNWRTESLYPLLGYFYHFIIVNISIYVLIMYTHM